MTANGLRPVDQDSVDETNILHRWLYQHAGHPAILPLTPPPGVPDWEAVTAAVARLSDEDLRFEPRPGGDHDELEDDWATGVSTADAEA